MEESAEGVTPSDYVSSVADRENVYEWDRILPLGDTLPARSGHSAVLLDDLIFVFGGHDGQSALNDLFTYSISENEWKEIHFKEED